MKAKKKILVIDDSEVNNILIKSIFDEKNKFILVEERNSINAWETIKKESPDLILLDLMMPNVDGMSILLKIRSDKSTEHIPVVVISAKEERSEQNKLNDLGISNYIRKPFNLNYIHSLAEEILGRS